jgi:general secretion pathway protein E
VDKAAWQQLTQPWKVKPPAQVFSPVGCLECRNSGFLGRQGIYEVMPLSETLSELIQKDVDIAKLRASSMREGMHTLRLSGAQKVGAGETTMAEVMRVAPATLS